MGIMFPSSFSLYDFELALERTGKLVVAAHKSTSKF